jgi:hypothetical protein
MVRRMNELGRDLVQWSSHPNSCPVCLPYNGNTYSLSGRDKQYPKATLLPPGHPRCKHVLTPSTVSFERFERELGLVPDEPPAPVETAAPTMEELLATDSGGRPIDPIGRQILEANKGLSSLAQTYVEQWLQATAGDPRLDRVLRGDAKDELDERVAAELAAAFDPIRAALRERYGDRVTLFRGQKFGDYADSPRRVFSYSARREMAEAFAAEGRGEVVAEAVDIDRLLWAMARGDELIDEWLVLAPKRRRRRT